MARVTCVSNLYFELPGEPVFGVSESYSYNNEAEDSPYRRIMTVGPEPCGLDPGWLTKPGLFHIENLGEQTIRITGGFLIPPRHCYKLLPKNFFKIKLYPKGETKIKLTVFPG